MMTKRPDHSGLHLPDLNIEGFRGIEKLSIPRLARVTLLTGKNGAGKTTVLDAVRAYAARGNISVLWEILDGREEFSRAIGEDGDVLLAPDWLSLFHGRDFANPPIISIGPKSDILSLELVNLDEDAFPDASILEDAKILKFCAGKSEKIIPSAIVFEHLDAVSPLTIRSIRGFTRDSERMDRSLDLKCELLGPGLLSSTHMAEFWDRVALTDAEDQAVEALKIILGDQVDRVTVVGGGRKYRRYGPDTGRGRQALAKLKGYDKPVPLKSCGDGAWRLFGVALALAKSAGGFLLIDEVENGLHWSIEQDFWRTVLRMAKANDVQVIATTHGWDCIAGFSKAMNETPEEDGLLLRLDRDGGRVRTMDYSEDQLRVASEQRIEVR